MSQRTNFYEGMEVSAHDMSWSQLALSGSLTNRFADFYNYGCVSGLLVSTDPVSTGRLAVSAGAAYDPLGERINVSSNQSYIGYRDENVNASIGTYTVVGRYVEGNDGIAGIDVDGISQFNHIHDSFSINVLKSGTDTVQTNDVVLSDVIVTLPGSTFIVNYATRNTASQKFPSTIVSQVTNILFDTLTSDPTLTATDRMLWWNETESSLKFWDGTAIRIVG